MKAKCLYNNGYEYSLTVGKVYEDARLEKGIFPGRDYIVLQQGDNGKEVVCHSWRFQIIND